MLLNMDWDSTAAIKEAEESDDPEVPAAVGYGALYIHHHHWHKFSDFTSVSNPRSSAATKACFSNISDFDIKARI